MEWDGSDSEPDDSFIGTAQAYACAAALPAGARVGVPGAAVPAGAVPAGAASDGAPAGDSGAAGSDSGAAGGAPAAGPLGDPAAAFEDDEQLQAHIAQRRAELRAFLESEGLNPGAPPAAPPKNSPAEELPAGALAGVPEWADEDAAELCAHIDQRRAALRAQEAADAAERPLHRKEKAAAARAAVVKAEQALAAVERYATADKASVDVIVVGLRSTASRLACARRFVELAFAAYE